MKKRDGEKKEKERKEMKEPAVRKLKRKKKDDGKIKEEGIEKRKQVTRGHNFVADGWAGASTHTNIHKKYLNSSFFHFSTRSSRTDGRTNGRTDKAL